MTDTKATLLLCLFCAALASIGLTGLAHGEVTTLSILRSLPTHKSDWGEEPGFRVRGIAAGFAWKAAADEIWYGADLRWSESLMRTFDQENHRCARSIYLFPDWDESQVRAHLASLPWSAFVGVE